MQFVSSRASSSGASIIIHVMNAHVRISHEREIRNCRNLNFWLGIYKKRLVVSPGVLQKYSEMSIHFARGAIKDY